MTEKIVAVIPCYQEAEHISNVVHETLPFVNNVIVTDDNSDDCTVLYATGAGAHSIHSSSKTRRGIGNNTWRGIWFALYTGADIIVTLDGDGQHDPHDIPMMLQVIRDGADIVLGSRFLGNTDAMPRPNKFANWTLNLLCHIGVSSSLHLTDTQCGFRAFRKEVFRDIRTTEEQFAFITEVVIKARKAGLVIAECPIKCIYHNGQYNHPRLRGATRGVKLVFRVARWRLWEIIGV